MPWAIILGTTSLCLSPYIYQFVKVFATSHVGDAGLDLVKFDTAMQLLVYEHPNNEGRSIGVLSVAPKDAFKVGVVKELLLK